MPDSLRASIIATRDNEFPVAERSSVELRLAAIKGSVVRPAALARTPVHAMQHAVAGPHEEQVAHDRGRREDSSTCLVLPAHRPFSGHQRPRRMLGRAVDTKPGEL